MRRLSIIWPFGLLLFAFGGGLGVLHAEYSCALAAILFGGCDSGKTADTGFDTGGFIEDNFCAPVSWEKQRTISDEQFEAIEETCNYYAVEGHADTLPRDNDLPQECLDAWYDVLPLDSSFSGEEGEIAARSIIKGMRVLMFYPLRIDSMDLELLDAPGLVCPYYSSEILAAQDDPWGETLTANSYYTNRTPVRYILERIKSFSYDGTLMDAAARESNGGITVGNHFGTGTGQRGTAAAGTLIHEARHIDSSSDDGAPHVDCLTEGMEGERFCDDNLTGANGLEVIFYDALIRGSRGVQGKLRSGPEIHGGISGPLLNTGETVNILPDTESQYMIYEMCATLTGKINNVPSELADIFAPYPSCLTDLYQNFAEIEEFLRTYYRQSASGGGSPKGSSQLSGFWKTMPPRP
ncbi:MAG: hypothetical protein HY547_02515 [Elusimicrobia bacterium]|nr:hypothetical protein [Elusimicrobiota bacterium]